MLVFREGRRTRSTRALATSLTALATSDSSLRSRETMLTALLQAGELECGLADAASESHPLAAKITDLLAGALLGHPQLPSELTAALERLRAAPLPVEVTISVPEGFAYYALHPLDYIAALKAREHFSKAAAVIGIRSIGTTLSAVVRAHFHSRGSECGRITVRPSGHPFDRQLVFDSGQAAWIEGFRQKSAEFYIVDEGPGLSGSSFLAVGEALLRAGVGSSSIVFMCSTQPAPEALLARNAAERWRSFRTLPAQSSSQLPSQAAIFIGGGQWRESFFREKKEWPAGWLQMERVKYLSRDRRWFFRFDGLGDYGEVVRARYRAVAQGGFGVDCDNSGDGFSRFPVLAGAPVSSVSRELLRRGAEYCAFRASEFAAAHVETASLEEMTRINIGREWGLDLGKDFRLDTVRPVIADGKMMLHEWLQPADGSRLLKLDCAAHGDDHFYPGPTDIAWDLAGATIEWKLSESESSEFLDQYRRLANDDARERLHGYRLAYAAFRMGYSKMAALAMRGSDEEARLWRDYAFYKEAIQRLCGASGSLQLSARGQ